MASARAGCKGASKRPAASVRVGRVDGKLIINPKTKQIEAGDLDLVVAAKEDAILMVECSAKELSEDEIVG